MGLARQATGCATCSELAAAPPRAQGSRGTDCCRIQPRLQAWISVACNPQEATNYAAALKLVESTGNVRGLGICHNNLANLAGQSKEVREQLRLSPEYHFEQAAAPTVSI